jgi:hypothetical protein
MEGSAIVKIGKKTVTLKLGDELMFHASYGAKRAVVTKIGRAYFYVKPLSGREHAFPLNGGGYGKDSRFHLSVPPTEKELLNDGLRTEAIRRLRLCGITVEGRCELAFDALGAMADLAEAHLALVVR